MNKMIDISDLNLRIGHTPNFNKYHIGFFLINFLFVLLYGLMMYILNFYILELNIIWFLSAIYSVFHLMQILMKLEEHSGLHECIEGKGV